jgi:hypothetical protein
MNRKRWLAVLGVVGIAAAVPSCGSQSKGPAVDTEPPPIDVATKADLKALRDSLATLLGKDGTDPKTNLNKWLQNLANSVCQIEEAAPDDWGLKEDVKYCTKGAGEGDKIVPPPFPPR